MTPDDYDCLSCNRSLYVTDELDPLDEDVRYCDSCAADEIRRLRAELTDAKAQLLSEGWCQDEDEPTLAQLCSHLAVAESEARDRLQAITDRLPTYRDGVMWTPDSVGYVGSGDFRRAIRWIIVAVEVVGERETAHRPATVWSSIEAAEKARAG